jgi:hypothetical protein|tara:strand:+ start:209 stop:529 length:321 start_codon:yes stop_codon:yes gene_type:complete
LFDEAKEIISSVSDLPRRLLQSSFFLTLCLKVSVDYIAGTLIGGVFCSVPIIVKHPGDTFDDAIKACMYLNTSIHQSKVSFFFQKWCVFWGLTLLDRSLNALDLLL